MQQQDNSASNMETASVLAQDLDSLLNQHFRGRVVRKDLTKQLKEGANVPVYVLEYLLGMSVPPMTMRLSSRGYSRLSVFFLITTSARMKQKK